jgi:hypothetical protein
MKILTTLILVSFAVPAFAINVVSNDNSTAKRCGLSTPQAHASRSYYKAQAGIPESTLPAFTIRGNADCSEKFVDLVSVEDRGADGEQANSDQEVLESLNVFQAQVQNICDTLNNSDQGQSKIQIENNSTTSGFYFGTGERVHLEFSARCIIQNY